MKIGIIGYGVVGKAISATFSKLYDIKKYDKYNNLDTFESLLSCEFIFVSVPTPFSNEKNKVNLDSINSTFKNLSDLDYKGIVIVKSTIPCGTSDILSESYSLDIVMNPEFLRESVTPNEDFKNQKVVVIGSKNKKIYESVKSLYETVLSEDCKYYFVDFQTAELIKYSQNMTLASRVAISNIVFDACSEFNVDYNLLREIAFNSFEILGPHMTQVPGPDGERGFGGKCLPKDTMGFNSFYPSDVVKSFLTYNSKLRDDIDKYEN